MVAMHAAMFGVLIRRYGRRVALVLHAVPHCDGGHAAQRQRDQRKEQDQGFEISGHFWMLARLKQPYAEGKLTDPSVCRNHAALPARSCDPVRR